MIFNKHSELDGFHAFLGASQYSWLNYDDDMLEDRYMSSLARIRGTQLHDFACQAIKLGIKLQDNATTINMYVNDAIGFRMTPEQPLYFSSNCFGTADAISFRNNKLRIHDLKTGITPASMKQLYIYAALFCLEYDMNPNDISIELRIYQADDVIGCVPEPEDIMIIMEKIKHFDAKLDEIKEEVR